MRAAATLPLMLCLGLGLSGCTDFMSIDDSPSETGCGDAGPSQAFPTLFVASEDGIRQLDWDPALRRYNASIFASTPNVHDLVASGPGVFAADADHLYWHDRKAELGSVRLAGPYGALEAHGEHLLAAGKGKLAVFGDALKPVAEQEFRKGTYKTAHDVLVCEGTAYILDNVVVPVFIYRVDVRDPADPSVLSEEEFQCMCHLPDAWIDPAAHRWYILESSGGMGYGAQHVRVHSTQTGKRLDTVRIYEVRYDYEANRPWTPLRNGTEVLAVTDTAPPWAVTTRDGQNLTLSKITVEGSTVRFEPGPSLGLRQGSLHLEAAGDRLVVTVGPTLRLVETAPSVKVVHTQTLPKGATALEAAGPETG